MKTEEMHDGKIEIFASSSVLHELKKRHIELEDFNQKIINTSPIKMNMIKVPFGIISELPVKLYVLKLGLDDRAICSYDWDAIHEVNHINVYAVCNHDNMGKTIENVTNSILAEYE